MIATFFNVQIVAAAWPILLHGLLVTAALSVVVVPLGFVRRYPARAAVHQPP